METDRDECSIDKIWMLAYDVGHSGCMFPDQSAGLAVIGRMGVVVVCV